MKPFTISEYQKDPSKLSSSLHDNRVPRTKHQVISGSRLLVEWGAGPMIYTEEWAAKYFVLRVQYRELKCRPWRDSYNRIWFCPEHAYNNGPVPWCGPEQTILVED